MDRVAPALTELDRNGLVSTNLYLVQHIVNQLAARYPRHVDRSELWSAGALGLVDASRRFDVSTGIPFVRYASIRIRGAVIDSTRTRDWASRSVRRGVREVQAVTEQFEESKGRQPSEPELAVSLGIDVTELRHRKAAAETATLLHLDQPSAGADAGTTALAATLEEQAPEWLPDAALERRELMGTVRVAVEHLPPVQRQVIARYYFQHEMLRDIAETFGVTEARISQIRSEAVASMQSYFATGYEGVPSVAESAPGKRQRAAYTASLAAHSTWRSRLEAADEAAVLVGATG